MRYGHLQNAVAVFNFARSSDGSPLAVPQKLVAIELDRHEGSLTRIQRSGKTEMFAVKLSR
ncbi:MAG: hypothetical protein DMG40_03525 [Acidobacteria bacterium]|nr:MAG: hypothetical protein DMG40_03525 [Acidobacteriota bacterium]